MQVVNIVKKRLLDIPSPINLSIWWNFGSILGLCLGLQLVTGILLACHYTCRVDSAFDRVIHIVRDVQYGWLIRVIHANGASLFFLCLFIHVGRGIYYGSYKFVPVWAIGVIILFVLMGTAFLGYVLPWGQISFWGASVITSLLTTVPYVGDILVEWVWGGPSIGNATLTRFYALHFILPFAIAGLSLSHIIALHETGSNNPLGVNRDTDKVPFHPYYTWKDIVGFVLIIILFITFVFFYPHVLFDPVNFTPADPLVTPVHIQPEWYFLFAYAVLRSIPNKLGGVIALVMSVAILLALPFVVKSKSANLAYYPLNQVIFWGFVGVFWILTWIGSCPVEYPYVQIGQVFSVIYFSYFLIAPLCIITWDKIIEWFFRQMIWNHFAGGISLQESSNKGMKPIISLQD